MQTVHTFVIDDSWSSSARLFVLILGSFNSAPAAGRHCLDGNLAAGCRR
jgi:hypothetical protein